MREIGMEAEGFDGALLRGRVRTGALTQLLRAKEGLGDQYWLFLGICLVGLLIAGPASFVLLGPMLVGIYSCFRKRDRGEAVEFSMLFEGFEKLSQTVVPNLLMFGMLLFFQALFALAWTVGLLVALEAEEPELWIVLLGVGMALLLLGGTLLANFLFFFTFHLVLDPRGPAFTLLILF